MADRARLRGGGDGGGERSDHGVATRACSNLLVAGRPRSARHELAFPGERVADDGRKVVETRPPAERCAQLRGIGHDPGRIAGPPRRDFDLEIDARRRA